MPKPAPPSFAIDAHAFAYVARLLLAAAVAAFALLDDAIEAAIGAMLISPLDEPIQAIGVALAAGDAPGVARALAVVAGSAVAFAGAGVAARSARQSYDLTPEMLKRSTRFATAPMFAFSFSLGAVGALAGRDDSVSAASTLAVGLAISVAVSVPLVNAGVMAVDAWRRRRDMLANEGVESHEELRDAIARTRASLSRAGVALVGLLVGRVAVDVGARAVAAA